MMAVLMHEHRNEAAGHGSPPETRSQYSAYFGTYCVDWESGIISHQVTGSLNGDIASGELRRAFSFKGADLILGFTTEWEGVPITRRLVWKRLPAVLAD
jgi:hypothetical protein